jgi:hypothetical protein
MPYWIFDNHPTLIIHHVYIKKNPQPSPERLGILPACTLHSLILEDFFVKNSQAGFLTLGSSYSLRLPTPRETPGSG